MSSGRNSKTHGQCVNVSTASPSAILPTSVANLLNVSNATNRMQLKTARNLLALLQNASTAGATTQPTSQDAPGINNNCIITNGQLLNNYTKCVFQNPPHPHVDTNNPIFQFYKLHTLRPPLPSTNLCSHCSATVERTEPTFQFRIRLHKIPSDHVRPSQTVRPTTLASTTPPRD